MLGLLVRFYVRDDVRLPVAMNVCLGVAIALGMSGVCSALYQQGGLMALIFTLNPG